jgi:hypothetical protein
VENGLGKEEPELRTIRKWCSKASMEKRTPTRLYKSILEYTAPKLVQYWPNTDTELGSGYTNGQSSRLTSFYPNPKPASKLG